MFQRGQMVLGIALAGALALTGCAGKARVASSKTCAAHGGTYNAASRACVTTANTKSAAQICQAQGGYYDTGPDVCELGND